MSAFPVLYPVIDVDTCSTRGIDPVALAGECLQGGARLLQLRVKERTSALFLSVADALVAAARPYDGRIIVNDRADIALMAGAAGVHVGQDDLPVGRVRAIVGARVTIGLSTHDRAQIDRAAEEDADYVAVGPVFGTASKDTGYDAVGLDLVRYAARVSRRPVVAIGGITLERATLTLAAGAASVAVISDLLATGDASARVRDYLRALDPNA
ncbi:MAG TPA: thiamine phosphate synthase [Vicinamibacterales bacterium]|nr:thiamine phosphate synthase [Vicinamibacterales bacterium]